MNKIAFNKFNKAPKCNFFWAFLTLFFFLPLGVVAIYKAIKVKKLWTKGLHDEAKQTAFFVRVVTIIGLTVGVVTYLSLAMVLSSLYLLN